MFRLCYGCYNTFEISKERTNYTFLCESCKDDPKAQARIFNHIAINRNINVEMFDSWADMDRSEKVCRVCGAKITDKRKCYCNSCDYIHLKREVGGHQLQFTASVAVVRCSNYEKYGRFKCEECESEGTDVHHIIPVHKSSPNFHLIFQIDNLILLCKECHKAKHTKDGNDIRVHKKLDEYLII